MDLWLRPVYPMDRVDFPPASAPSQTTPRLSSAVFARLVCMNRPTPSNSIIAIESDARNIPDAPCTDNPRVQIQLSPLGTVTIVGVTLAGRWVAEYTCEVEDFDDRCVLAMERRVKLKERKIAAHASGARPRATSRVLPFPGHA